MSEWTLTHQPCPKCGSSDAYSINDRGWGKCFSCGKNVNEEVTLTQPTKMLKVDRSLLEFGEYAPLTKRGLTEETCRKFGYFLGTLSRGEKVQVAPYRNRAGELIAQKSRTADKKFLTHGDFKEVVLFGQHLWKPGGKRLIITEGEIDCMTVSQLQGNKWPVVSLQNGAQAAAASVKKELEWVSSFEEVVVLFDMDEAGEKAAVEVAELLPPGKALIAKLPMKDANEMLQAGQGDAVVTALWQAQPYRPDGLVEIDQILEDIEKPIEIGLPWWSETLTAWTYGRRWGEVYGLGAGTGVGKTDFFTQQIEYDVNVLNQRVGLVFLEQKPVETAKRVAGKFAGKRFHVPDGSWTAEELREAVHRLRGKVTFYDSFGETDWEVVKTKIRYMAVSQGIRIFYVDHLTAMADTSNEKESLEQIMKEMAGLANELQIIITFISHLSTPEGKPHEEGGRVMIKHFKGSRSIGFWSYFMFGMERDQQAEDLTTRQTTTFRILKDRFTGQATGQVIYFGYDREKGRLYETASGPTSEHGFSDETVRTPETADQDF